MRVIPRTFINGLLTLLPLLLTVYPLFLFFTWLNDATGRIVRALLPELAHVPGLGIVLGAGVVFALGLAAASRVTRPLYRIIEAPFRNVPIVKELYFAIKQLTDYLAPSSQRRADKVVLCRLPGQPVEVMGLLMRGDLADLPEAITRDGRVAVYFPMSYQIGGFTVFLPREWITPVDMPVERAMREVLTGWLRRPGGADVP